MSIPFSGCLYHLSCKSMAKKENEIAIVVTSMQRASQGKRFQLQGVLVQAWCWEQLLCRQFQTLRPELHIQSAIPMCGGSQIRLFASGTDLAWQSLKSTVQGLGTLRIPNEDDERKSKEVGPNG